jgi:peroxiredoxin
MHQLGELKSLLSENEKREIQMVALSQDTHDESRNMGYQIVNQPGKLDFPLLEDRHHEVVDRYGIVNPTDTYKAGLPYPAIYVINKQGVIVQRFLDEKGSRPTIQDVRGALKKLGLVK